MWEWELHQSAVAPICSRQGAVNLTLQIPSIRVVPMSFRVPVGIPRVQGVSLPRTKTASVPGQLVTDSSLSELLAQSRNSRMAREDAHPGVLHPQGTDRGPSRRSTLIRLGTAENLEIMQSNCALGKRRSHGRRPLDMTTGPLPKPVDSAVRHYVTLAAYPSISQSRNHVRPPR